jgi:hypothetical protein
VAAVGVGVLLALAYYARFVPLALAQLPRVLQGSGAAAGATAARPLVEVLRQWGLPVMALAAAGLPRPRAGGLDRDLAAYWTAGLALAVLAAASPLDVRYLHALGLPLAVAAAEGSFVLWGKGAAGRIAVLALAAAQVALAARNLVEALLWRYRPWESVP